MKLFITSIALGAGLLAAGANAVAQSGAAGQSTPVGYMRFTLPEASDTFVGLPLKQSVDSVGQVVSAANVGEATVLDVAGMKAGFSASAPLHYLRFSSGALSGEYYLIESIADGVVTISNEGFDLSAAQDAEVEIVRAWTLDTLFAPSLSGTPGFPLVVSAGKLPFQRGSQIIVYENNREGINLSPVHMFFLTAEGWLSQGTGFPPAGDFVLHPDSFIVIRQPAGAGQRSFALGGMVEAGDLASIVSTRKSGSQDTLLSLARATDLALSELQLDGFEASPGVLPFQRRDELIVWEQNGNGINRAPVHLFFRVGNTWIRKDTGFPVADHFVLKSGTPFIVRKAASVDGAQIWKHQSPVR